jgi:hypothetical protein
VAQRRRLGATQVGRLAVADRRHPELGQHRGQRAGALAEAVAQRLERRAARPAAQHLDERRVRGDRLLVEAPVEHHGTFGVRLAGELGGQAGLADPGVAAEERELPPARRGRPPGGAQLAQRPIAADEAAAVGGRRERRGPRDRRQRRPGGVRRALAAHQPGVHCHRARPRRRPQLVAQEPPQVVEGAHGLGVVAAGLVDLHEQPVPRLAERRGRDERARGALRDREGARAQARLGEALERLDPYRLELAAALLDPRALQAGQERAPVRAERRRGMPGRGRPVAGDARRSGPRGGRLGRLDVDPHRLLQRELGVAAAGRHPVAERLAQL